MYPAPIPTHPCTHQTVFSSFSPLLTPVHSPLVPLSSLPPHANAHIVCLLPHRPLPLLCRHPDQRTPVSNYGTFDEPLIHPRSGPLGTLHPVSQAPGYKAGDIVGSNFKLRQPPVCNSSGQIVHPAHLAGLFPPGEIIRASVEVGALPSESGLVSTVLFAYLWAL
jgi:hypothetical protein